MRKKIYINGFEWWLNKESFPPRVFLTETSEEVGISIYSNHFMLDEKRQIEDYIKYGKNDENGK